MPRGRPPNPKPEPGNVSRETFLEIYESAIGAKTTMDEARSVYQGIFKKAEGLGINRKALSAALREAARDRDQREIDHRDYVQYMAWIGSPIGTQAEMNLTGVRATDEPGVMQEVRQPRRGRRQTPDATSDALQRMGDELNGDPETEDEIERIGREEEEAHPEASPLTPYQQGRRAFQAGASRDDNPWDRASEKGEAWDYGYAQASDATRASVSSGP